MPSVLAEHWKAAAQSSMMSNDVENAFMNQAYSLIQNKAGQFMDDAHRVGFEIVYKNDTNNRIVGIFAFKAGQELFYCPTFFLNGNIKGSDLLYRHSTKTFVPLTEDWASFLIEHANLDSGRGIDRKQTLKGNPEVQMHRLAYPPAASQTNFKVAHSLEGLDKEAAWKSFMRRAQVNPENELIWEKFAADACTIPTLGKVLRSFLVDAGSTDPLDTLMKWAKESHNFASALAYYVEPEDYTPPELLSKLQKAAAQPEELVLYRGGMLHKSASETNRDHFLKHSYMLTDNREKDKLTTVYEDKTERRLHGIEELGTYDVLMPDGSFKSCLCGPLNDRDEIGHTVDVSGTRPVLPSGDSNYPSQKDFSKPRACIQLEGDKAYAVAAQGEAQGEVHNEQNLKYEDGPFSKTVEAGKAYVVIDVSRGEISRPFYVDKVENLNGEDNVKKLTVFCVGDWVRPRTLLHNPDYTRIDLSKCLGEPARFLEVGVDQKPKANVNDANTYDLRVNQFEIGGKDAVEMWIHSHGMKRASVKFDGDHYQFTCGREASPMMKRSNLHVRLASQLGMHADMAAYLLDQAEANRTAGFFIDAGVDKIAGTVQVMGDPDFSPMHDAEFDTQLDIPRKYILPTMRERDVPPQPNLGDGWDPGMRKGIQNTDTPEDKSKNLPLSVILASQPDQLANLAKQQGLPHVFEHGVVASLAQTYDASSMLDQYLPKLEEGLDALGRSLFLFYWKPQDFQQAFGADDMTNLENELTSNFKSFGDLVLNLLKKSKSHTEGSAAVSS